MQYAKLINGRIQYAPNKIIDGNTVTYNPPADMLLAEGYLPVRMAQMPEVENGYKAEMNWEQTEDAIIQTWDIVPDPEWNEISPYEIAEALEAIL